MTKNLLTHYLVLLFLFISPALKAQWVTIPDANFVTYLQTNFASCMNGNQMDTTCAGITNATSVSCVNKNISDLDGIQYFDNLQTLNCTSNNLTSLNNLPTGLTTLYCVNNDLASIASFPPNLTYLDCTNNLLTSLPVFTSGLTTITVNSNNLTTLPNLPSNLITLNANYNQLNSLPTLPSSLINLFVTNNQLTLLPSLPLNLVRLSCTNNQIVFLPGLPATLNLLQCGYNPLNSLPSLPTQLDTLDVSHCQFGSLPVSLPSSLVSLFLGNPGFIITPVLPAGLLRLGIYNSELTTFPVFPANLTFLDLRENDLATSIPTLPPLLELFSAINNDLIQTIPALPNGITMLYITNSNVAQIPELPDSLNYFYLDNNPLLLCLPELKTINYFSWQNTGITCLPNYGNVTTSLPSLSSLPLCDMFNTNACNFYFNIAGKVYADNNTNCLPDPSETIISPVKINLYQGGNLVQQTYTSSGGVYNFDATIGSYYYSVDTVDVPFLVLCPLSGEHQSVLTLADSVDLNMNFGLQCKLQSDLGTLAIFQDSGLFRPANNTLINVVAGDMAQVYNLNCASGVSGTVTVFYSGPLIYAGNAPGSIVPVTSLNTLTYNIADFGMIDIHHAFQFYLTTNAGAQAGDQVCITVNVTLLPGDLNPSNNILTHCFSVINSYDPNVKEVSPIDIIANTGDWLTYTIHFQNTGNAPAQHIVITDTLDSKLQESTFTFLSSSHDPFIQVTGNVVKFNFPNINLPDSTSDEPNSHGYVQYKVKIDQGLSLGQTIENNAAIYFDFNAPVITNTTVTTIVLPTIVNDIKNEHFSVYPNPVEDILSITTNTNGFHHLTVTDFTGRVVYKNSFSGNEFRVDVKSIAGGLYFVNLEDAKDRRGVKVVVN